MFVQVVFPEIENIEIPLRYENPQKAQTTWFTRWLTYTLTKCHYGLKTEKLNIS